MVPHVRELDVWRLLREGLESNAERRDRAAAARDRRAEQRDRQAYVQDRELELFEAELGPEFDGYRRRVRAYRQAMIEHRHEAARDRALSALDRDVGRRDRQLSGQDELTGALRRGVGLAALEREVARAERAGEPLVVVFLDVDHLKQVNDRDGHAAGDSLLRRVAGEVRAHLRPYDLMIRFGGDEFVCALAGAEASEVRERFAAVERALRPQGASFTSGFAQCGRGDSAYDLVERADADLLAARAARARA